MIRPRAKAMLNYWNFFNHNLTATAMASVIFRANSARDPLVALGGTGAYGFDFMAARYNHYIVLGAKVTATIRPLGSSFGDGKLVFGIRLDDDSVWIPSNYQNIKANATTRNLIDSDEFWSTNKSITITNYYSCRKFFNVKDPRDNKYQLGAAVTGDPADGAFFHVFLANPDLTGYTSNQYCIELKISYVTSFGEKKEFVQTN